MVEVPPPWESDWSGSGEGAINSPVSAGVDGTDSASGVRRILDEHVAASSWKSLISPRSASSVEDGGSHDRSWFGISLDGRTMKTPMGQPLAVPSMLLAHGIAAEWDAQTTHLQPANMPLMTLTCTALDQAAHHPHVYREQALNFLPTDTVSDEWHCLARDHGVVRILTVDS